MICICALGAVFLRHLTVHESDFGQSIGYSVETVPFSSGKSFLDAFDKSGFDLVFMDIYMEGIDGISAALKMRNQDKVNSTLIPSGSFTVKCFGFGA